MRDEDKTREELLAELRDLRRLVEMEGAPLSPQQKENFDRFRLLYEEAPLPYQSLDENGNFIDVNQAWLDVLGYTEAEVVGRNFGDFVHPDSVAHFKENFPRFKAAGEVLGVEFELVKKDGSIILVAFNGKIGRDHQGKFLQTHCVFQDITERRQAEEDLIESERRYRALFENMVSGFVLFEVVEDYRGVPVDLLILGANKVFEKTTGLKASEVIGRRLTQVLPGIEKDTTDWIATYGKVALSGEALQFESGSELLGVFFFITAYQAGPKLCGVTFQDITERKHAEDVQARLQAQLSSALEIARLGPWEYDVLNDIFTFNDHFYRIFRTSAEQAGGYTMSSAQYASRFIHPEDIDVVAEEIQRATESMAPGFSRKLEHRILYADGGVGFISVQIFVVKDPRGKTIKTYGVNQDVTERKKVEQELRESEARFKALHDASFGGIAIHDMGTILECNQGLSEIFGYSAEELAGMDGLLLISEKSRDSVRRRVLAGKEKPYEAIGLRKDGTEFSVRIEGRNIPYKGKLVRATEFRDISEFKRGEREREKLRAQLNQAQKLESVGRLAGGVAHDFNNMLGVILGHVEMALEEIDQSHPLLANLMEIRTAALRSADLTRQLLAFARRQTISPKVLDLNETVEGMLKMLRRLIGEDIDLAWLPAKSLWPVKVDPGQIDQILANLCVNARDAISASGKIIIETGAVLFDEDSCMQHPGFVPGDFVMLSVSDNGCGMDKETLAKIFEPFYTTKGVGKGTGLGLATVYGIVKQNNGFINVYSEPGQGTTVKIYIPRAEEQKVERSPAPLERDLRGRETVLLVEDEEPMLALGKTILQRHGYEVLATGSPSEALAMAERHGGPIHLLLTDVVMPGMNGRELRDKLAQVKPGFKNIFMSGYTANAIAHHGILDEGVDFLAKPFSVKTLLEKVRDVLDG